MVTIYGNAAMHQNQAGIGPMLFASTSAPFGLGLGLGLGLGITLTLHDGIHRDIYMISRFVVRSGDFH